MRLRVAHVYAEDQVDPARTEALEWLERVISPDQPRLVWVKKEGGIEIEVKSYDLGVVPGA
jgi:hypothetical protein